MKRFKTFFAVLLLAMSFAIIPGPANAAQATPAAKLDTQPPAAPAGLLAVNITHTSVLLKWTGSSDNVGVKGYYVYRDGKKIIATSKTSFTNLDLIPGRKYTYSVKAYDAAGNISPASNLLDVSTTLDNQAPSPPGGLAVSSAGYTSAVVSWSPSTDNISVRGYVIYKNGSRAASTSATSCTIRGLMPGTTYSFFVKAYDIAGNFSCQSMSVPVATLPDTAAPTKPCGLKSTSVTETEINLTWTPSTDNVKVKGYEIYCNGERKGTSSKNVYSCRNLVPGKAYTFAVKAVDTVGNRSAGSDTATATTLKDVKSPTAPTGLKAGKAKGTTVSLEWNASSDNVKIGGYTVYCNGIPVANASRTSKTLKSQSGLRINIYWVRAYDIAGNLSDASNKITVISP